LFTSTLAVFSSEQSESNLVIASVNILYKSKTLPAT